MSDTTGPRWRTAALVAVLVALPFLPALVRPSGTISSRHSDVVAQSVPWRAGVARHLAEEGRIPDWNPVPFAGLDVKASLTHPLWYPPFLAHLFSTSPWLFTLQLALHSIWMALGTAFLARRMGLGAGGAVFAAVAFAMGARVSGQVYAGHVSMIAAISWTPWLLASAERMRRDLGAALPAGLCAGMMLLTGHLQIAEYALLATGAWAVSAALRDTGERPRRLACAVVGLGITGALGLLVAAIQILPSFLESARSGRFEGLDPSYAGIYSMSPTALSTLLLPLPLGHPEVGTYWGPENQWERNAYLGVPVLALAALGFLGGKGERGRWLLPVVALGCLLFAMGPRTPVFGAAFRIVPGLDRFRVPARALLFASLAASLLAARGLEVLIEGARSRRFSKVLSVTAALAVLSALVWFVVPGFLRTIGRSIVTAAYEADLGGDGHSQPLSYWLARVERILETMPPAFLALALLLVALAVLVRMRDRLSPRAVATLCVVLLVAEAGYVSARFLSWEDPTTPRGDAAIADRIASEEGLHRTLDQCGAVPMSVAFERGLDLVGGYDPLIPHRYLRYASGMAGLRKDEPPATDVEASRKPVDGTWRRAWLDGLGVRFVVAKEDLTPLGFRPLEVPGARSGILHENPRALPRATLHSTWKPVDGLEDALAAMRGSEDFVLVVEYAESPPPDATSGEVGLLERGADRVVLETRSRGPTMLFLSEGWAPGWSAEVDGKAAEILVANAAFRAVALPAGDHRVAMRYATPGQDLGRTISLVVAPVVLAAWLLLRRRRRAKAVSV